MITSPYRPSVEETKDGFYAVCLRGHEWAAYGRPAPATREWRGISTQMTGTPYPYRTRAAAWAAADEIAAFYARFGPREGDPSSRLGGDALTGMVEGKLPTSAPPAR
jgi:hypothetical protein